MIDEGALLAEQAPQLVRPTQFLGLQSNQARKNKYDSLMRQYKKDAKDLRLSGKLNRVQDLQDVLTAVSATMNAQRATRVKKVVDGLSSIQALGMLRDIENSDQLIEQIRNMYSRQRTQLSSKRVTAKDLQLLNTLNGLTTRQFYLQIKKLNTDASAALKNYIASYLSSATGLVFDPRFPQQNLARVISSTSGTLDWTKPKWGESKTSIMESIIAGVRNQTYPNEAAVTTQLRNRLNPYSLSNNYTDLSSLTSPLQTLKRTMLINSESNKAYVQQARYERPTVTGGYRMGDPVGLQTTAMVNSYNPSGKERYQNLNRLYLTNQQLQDVRTIAPEQYIWSGKKEKYVLGTRGMLELFPGGVASASSAGNVDKRRSVSISLINSQASQINMQRDIPMMVQSVTASNQQLGYTGLGPISTKGLPLYAGRYLDPVTGQVRTVKQISSRLINPGNVESLRVGYQTNLLSKWNSYVTAQESLLKFYEKYQKGYDFSAAAQRRASKMTTAQGMKKIVMNKLKGLAKHVLMKEPIYGISPGTYLYRQIVGKLEEPLAASNPFKKYEFITALLMTWGNFLRYNSSIMPIQKLKLISSWAWGAMTWGAQPGMSFRKYQARLKMPALESKTYEQVQQIMERVKRNDATLQQEILETLPPQFATHIKQYLAQMAQTSRENMQNSFVSLTDSLQDELKKQLVATFRAPTRTQILELQPHQIIQQRPTVAFTAIGNQTFFANTMRDLLNNESPLAIRLAEQGLEALPMQQQNRAPYPVLVDRDGNRYLLDGSNLAWTEEQADAQ